MVQCMLLSWPGLRWHSLVLGRQVIAAGWHICVSTSACRWLKYSPARMQVSVVASFMLMTVSIPACMQALGSAVQAADAEDFNFQSSPNLAHKVFARMAIDDHKVA